MIIKPGTRIELYNGSGAWGYADGEVTDSNEETVICHFTPRPPGKGDSFTEVFTKHNWETLLANGYLTIK